MGLMLSVFVFCVGIAEALDFWHHILLHLAQPQHSPLPYHLDLTADILSERELTPTFEIERLPKVDICWPKDLSPTDDLHVIKKRSHSECERKHDQDKASLGHHSTRNVVFYDKHPNPSQVPIVSSFTPKIEIHLIDGDGDCDGNDTSPVTSRENSPGLLELDVIVESDSSSEFDEPTQIENVAYVKKVNSIPESSVDVSNLFHISETIPTESNEESPSNTKSTNEPEQILVRQTTLNDDTIKRKTDLIHVQEHNEAILDRNDFLQDHVTLTDGVSIESSQIASDCSKEENKISSDPEQRVELVKTTKSTSRDVIETTEPDILFSLSDTQNNSFPQNMVDSDNLQSNMCSVESPFPTTEVPEVKFHESSPVRTDESTESSLNTSDASWMVKSRTSDRPLVIRYSPQNVASDFMSVTKTDLQAFKNERKAVETSKCDQKEADTAISNSQEQSKDLSGGKGIGSRERPLQMPQAEDDPSGLEVSNDIKHDNFGEEKDTSDQLETNSSSSSLSGIPQLPEDVRDSNTNTSLPSDNGYGKSSLQTQDTLDSGSDYLVQSSSDSFCVDVVCNLETIQSTKGSSSEIIYENNQSVELEDPGTNKPSGVVQTEIFENVCAQPLVIVSQSNILGDDFAQSSLKNPSSLPCLDRISSDELPAVSTKPHVFFKTEESPTTQSVQPSDHRPSLSDHERASQLTVTRDNPEQGTIEKIRTDLSDADFKPKPLQRRDTKRKSKITPRTYSRTNSSTSDEIEALCLENEPSETDSTNYQATIVSLRTSPLKSEKEDPADLPLLDKPEVAGPSSAGCSSGIPPTVEHELIFSGEYTKAMNKDWHSGHFCCWQCDESLTGQRYVLRDDHPYCIKCYESVFANGCEECSKTIGIDSKDLSYKDKHWHEACFLCNKCRVSLVDKQFGSKLDKIFCANCYDAQFASRCDGCGQIFKAGTKKMEYKTRQWHEPCFACCVCKTAIGTKSFIPREQEIYCATCYEEKFATRCVKCNKVITSGGVTYKNEPWHRECFTCTNCSTSLAGQRFTSRDEKPYCAECFGELFAKRCTACCKPITGIGGTRFISFEDRHWHNDCFICASCKASLVGRGFITDAEDIICPECAKQKLM